MFKFAYIYTNYYTFVHNKKPPAPVEVSSGFFLKINNKF
jgi:hypothetical protein